MSGSGEGQEVFSGEVTLEIAVTNRKSKVGKCHGMEKAFSTEALGPECTSAEPEVIGVAGIKAQGRSRKG